MKLTQILKKGKKKKDKSPRLKEKASQAVEEDFFSADLLIDLVVKDNKMVVKAAVAGVTPENLDVSIEDNVLTISGYRENEQTEEEGDYYYQECYWGGFTRSVALPYPTDSKKVSADIKEGILTITLPVNKTSKKIPIHTRKHSN